MSHQTIVIFVIVEAVIQLIMIAFWAYPRLSHRISFEWEREFFRPHRKYGFYVWWWGKYYQDAYYRTRSGTCILHVIFNHQIAKKEMK